MSLDIDDNKASQIRKIGIVLLILGGALAIWGFTHFSSLPNYQRLGILIPLLFAKPMVDIDTYRKWESVSGYWRGKAIGLLIAPPMVTVGAIVWYLMDPQAKA